MAARAGAPPHRGTALVTGGARRIGREIALGLAEIGYGVAVHYHNADADARAVVERIAGAGGRAGAFRCDLRDGAAPQRLVAEVETALGPLTCLVNNAARFDYDDAATLTAATWDAHLDVNLRAPVLLSQAFAARFGDGAQGNIVNMIDERVWKLVPTHFSYTVSKAGLWAATQMLAQSLAPRIRVNAIGPGPTLPNKHQSPEQFAQENRTMLLGRGTTPGEIVAAMRFILGSPAMTGQMIALDGGQHLLWRTPDMQGMEIAAPDPLKPAHEKGSP
jgi:NAD(P)-dependent dehydrogenase (short-subunit alcohol dehydrogenase family)